MAEDPSDSHAPIAEISHAPNRFEQFLDRNQKALVLGGILLAAAAAGWIIFRGIEDNQRLEAGEALVGAEDAGALEQIPEKFPKTPAAPTAELLLSDEQWAEGQQTAAIETLRTLLEKHGDHPTAVAAQARLATRLLQQGNYPEAENAFQQLLDQDGADYMAPYARLRLAEIKRRQKDLAAAEAQLDQATDARYLDNPLRSLAVQASTYVQFEMPEEVDPPEPEESAETATEGEPDFSKPITLDPSQVGGRGGNPLLETLPGTAPPAGETPPTETIPETAPAESTPTEPAAPSDGE